MRKILRVITVVVVLIGSLGFSQPAEAASVCRIGYEIVVDSQTGQIKSVISGLESRLKFVRKGLFHVYVRPGMAIALIRENSGLEGTVRWHGFETLRSSPCGDVLLLPLLDFNRHITFTPQGRHTPDITIRVFIRE